MSNDYLNTIVAGESLVGKKGYIVQLDAAGKLEVGEGATDLLVGVLVTEAEAAQAAGYQFNGIARVILGDTVAIGAFLTTDGSGKAIATTTDGDVVIGRALQGGVVNDVIEVQMNIFRTYVA